MTDPIADPITTKNQTRHPRSQTPDYVCPHHTLGLSIAASLAILAPTALWLQLHYFNSIQPAYAWSALACHVLAVCLTLALWKRSPLHPDHRPTSLSLTVFMLILPMVGVLVVLFIHHQLQHLPTHKPQWDWLSLSIAPPPHHAKVSAVTSSAQDPFYVLRHSRSVQRKKAMLLGAKTLPPTQACRLFRLALTDPNDEIRLIGVSQLKRVEHELNTKLYTAKSRFTHASAAQRAAIALTIAQLYFDFLYLHIADPALRSHYLSEANRYCAFALEGNLPEAALLAARIALMADEPKTANQFLSRIGQNTLPLFHVMPYLAETAFAQGEYALIKPSLHLASARSRSLNRVQRFWQ